MEPHCFSCIKWQGSKHLGHLPLFAQEYEQGAGSEVEQSGLELELIWDAVVAGSSLKHRVTVPALFI